MGFALRSAVLAACAIASAACQAPQASPEPTSAAPEGATARPAGSPSLPVTVQSATYGALEVRTAPGAKCTAELGLRAVVAGERAPRSLPEQTADKGFLQWTYPTPRMAPGPGTAEVTCTSGQLWGTASGRFDIQARAITASGFTVHLTDEEPPGAPIFRDASLVQLRDDAIRAMRTKLADGWRIATRGQGALRIVEESADITIFVAAAQGTSQHRLASDKAEDVVIYVSEPGNGPSTVDNLTAVALHELGHIWCCYGDGTYPRGSKEYGHWLSKERDPRLYGIDKYGLMNDPVICGTFGAIVSCPDRFSDREMVQLGFASFPAPVPDPCIAQALPLKQQLDATRAQMDKLKSDIDSAKVTLADLAARISAIEKQYPGGAPPSVVDTYRDLIAQYNALGANVNTWVAQYNDLLAKARSLGAQLSALPCDPS